MIVPFPGVDWIAYAPPESLVRSLMPVIPMLADSVLLSLYCG